MNTKSYISLFFLSVLSISVLISQDDIRMIEDRISAEKVTELGEKVDIVKTRKVWQARQGFGGDTTVVNSRGEAQSQDYKESKEKSQGPNLAFLEPLFFLLKYSMIILLIAAVIYVVVMALQHVKDDSDTEVIIDEDIAFQEEDIREMDLDGMLREALASENYKLAIRAKFLLLLKDLTDKELIDWSPEKTNRDYIRELRKHPSINTFRQATLGYELAWYGDQDANQQDFESFEALTQHFQNSITSHAPTAV